MTSAPPDMPDAKIKGAVIGGPGQCLAVANYTKYPEMVMKLISFLSSKAECIELAKSLSKMPIRKDITPQEVGYDTNPLQKKLFEISNNFIFWPDNTLVTDAMDELAKVAPLVLVGKISPQDAAASMDKKMAEVK